MSRSAAFLFIVIAALSAGAAAAFAQDSSSVAVRTKGPAPPAERQYSYAYDIFDNSLVRPATRFFDVALLARRISGHPREAANVDADDQVRQPSTWWQPRVGFRTVTIDQMLTGPGSGTGPAAGRWLVTKAKLQGVTPGFQIEDAAGAKYVIKFDPPHFEELSTSCDVIGSRLLWASGYNVPDNTISSFALSDLDIRKGATYTDATGKKQPITPEYLVSLLTHVSAPVDGRYRCSTSRLLDGKPLGAFKFEGCRKDDPEDRIPHELHRELRGYWVICAWLNHEDSRGPNSLDMWATDHGRSFVRHYLIDFNAILGASATGQRAYATGTQYYADFLVTGRAIATAGLAPFKWEAVVDPGIPAVGFVESKVFDPVSWRPDYPNPAFDDRTVHDLRWGAHILAGFTDAHIRAAIGAARFSDPRAADYLARVLIERRDKLVARWLGTSTASAATR